MLPLRDRRSLPMFPMRDRRSLPMLLLRERTWVTTVPSCKMITIVPVAPTPLPQPRVRQ
jgi:hypothetical protein